jgi:hypothetical protein
MAFLYAEEWYTIAVTALPLGWFNVYDIDGEEHKERCPALLLQEHRKTVKYDRDKMKTEDVKHHTAPLDTRVAFAEHENGTLTPAAETHNYLRTEYYGEA